MKSPKERQRAYRERRKEQKSAGLTKLKILVSATVVKRLEILSEIDRADMGTLLGQAVEWLWAQRFGNSEVVPESVTKPEKVKVTKAERGKPEKEKAVKSDKSKKKPVKSKSEVESGSVVLPVEG
ncbi:MAG TPA: hypothetical protein P5260_16745 [Candidatus Competibacter sp.]|nr:hypothetical protein [Candidatus Competibacter sp.]